MLVSARSQGALERPRRGSNALQDGRAMSFDDIVTTGLGRPVRRCAGVGRDRRAGRSLPGLSGRHGHRDDLVRRPGHRNFAGWLVWLLWGPGAEVAPGRDQIGVAGAFGAFGGFGGAGRRRGAGQRARTAAPARAEAGVSLSRQPGHRLHGVGQPGAAGRRRDGPGHGGGRDARHVSSTAWAACGCWFAAASVLGQGLKLVQTLFFLLLGGGFYLAAQVAAVVRGRSAQLG